MRKSGEGSDLIEVGKIRLSDVQEGDVIDVDGHWRYVYGVCTGEHLDKGGLFRFAESPSNSNRVVTREIRTDGVVGTFDPDAYAEKWVRLDYVEEVRTVAAPEFMLCQIQVVETNRVSGPA